jgi:hypothetical protein
MTYYNLLPKFHEQEKNPLKYYPWFSEEHIPPKTILQIQLSRKKVHIIENVQKPMTELVNLLRGEIRKGQRNGV